jgi:transcriptional regulator with XRE-family HTH domain
MARSVHTDAYRSVAKRLVAARKAAGLSQQQVADKLKRPQSYVAKVEGAERRLDIIEFLELAQAIGADPVELIRGVKLLKP